MAEESRTYQVVFGRELSLCILSVCVATGLVTVYVFQEPSLLSSLQDNGLTDVVLHALLVKDVSFHLAGFLHCGSLTVLMGGPIKTLPLNVH